MIRRRRMIRCWPISGSAGCPAGRSVTAACPASGLTGPTCASSVTCGRKPQDRPVNFRGKRGIPNAKHGLHLHNELLASGLHRYALSRDGVPVKSTERRLPREPVGDGDLAGVLADRDAHRAPGHRTQAGRTLIT